MPIITVYSNLPAESAAKLDANFRKSFLELLAETLQKPVEFIGLIMSSDFCQFGPDSQKPAIILNVKAIGHLNPEENPIHTKRITDFLVGHLQGVVEPSRVLIHFQNLEKYEVGKNGTTVEILLGKQ